MKELRTSNRYQLAAQVFFSLSRSEERPLQHTGITRDISVRGVSFLTAAKVKAGSHIELDVYFPSLRNQVRGMKLHGEGTVVRVESTGSGERVAAEVLFEREPETTFLVASTVQ